MRRCTFRDETQSALKDIERSVSLVRRCNDSVAAIALSKAIRKLKYCANVVRYCDRMIRDDRRFRGSGKHLTVWEMRTLFGLPWFTPNGKVANGFNEPYDGERLPDGTCILFKRGRRGEKPERAMTSAEMDKKFNEFWAEKTRLERGSKGSPNYGSAGYAGSGAKNGSTGLPLGSFSSPAEYNDPNADPAIVAKVLRAAKMIGEIALTIGAIKVTKVGDKLAEAGGQVGRFARFIAEKVGQIKQKLTGHQ